MMLDYANVQTPAYRLNDDLAKPSYISTVHRFSLDDTEEENAVLEKLGSRGWGRVHYFRSHFDIGWGENGNGKTLSPRAYDAFLRFVQVAQFPAGIVPSVFLTDGGGIELSWEDQDGHPVQIEFQRDGAEYFLGATQTEGFSDYQKIDGLVHALET